MQGPINFKENNMLSNSQVLTAQYSVVGAQINSLEYLQNRVTSLESRLQQAIVNSVKKEDYVNKLSMDLEHIIMQLHRLNVVKQKI